MLFLLAWPILVILLVIFAMIYNDAIKRGMHPTTAFLCATIAFTIIGIIIYPAVRNIIGKKACLKCETMVPEDSKYCYQCGERFKG